MGRRVRHSREFKLEAVRLFELDQKPASELALELGIRRNQLYKWKNSLEAKARRPFAVRAASGHWKRAKSRV